MKDRYVPGETEPPDGLRLGHDGKLEPIPDPDIAPRRRHGQGRSRSAFYEARDRRNRFVALTEEGKSLDEACAAVGVVRNTYARWRERFPDFAARVDVARAGHKDVTHIDYRGNFTSFRKRYLKMDTTWFQHQFVTALEECPPGEIIMVLWPPEHGKTTTIEDFVNYRLGIDPNSRITVVSERQAHAKRIVRRVRRRMEMDGPTRDYVRKFGPFEVPRDDKHRSKQPWTDEHLDVWKRSVEHFDERDYNLQAVGLGTTIQGVRADWMIFDDIQGLKSINMTESNFELIRQDFFSRPGILGRIVFCGTRVGDNDIYQRLMEEGLIDRLILFPAHDSHGEWLWPERYSEQQYLRLRKRVGEPAWFRNYMQRPTMGKEATFDRDVMLECCNDRRSVDADCPSDPDRPGATVPVTIQVDPALGGANATTVVGLHQRQLVDLDGPDLRRGGGVHPPLRRPPRLQGDRGGDRGHGLPAGPHHRPAGRRDPAPVRHLDRPSHDRGQQVRPRPGGGGHGPRLPPPALRPPLRRRPLQGHGARAGGRGGGVAAAEAGHQAAPGPAHGPVVRVDAMAPPAHHRLRGRRGLAH
jgi:hypothetical protein